RRYPSDAAEHVRWLREQGTLPVVAHPERHNYFEDDPDRLRALVDAGAWLQITVDSLLGNHGWSAQAAAEVLLRTYSDVVLATDSHGTHRCSGLSPGYTWVREKFGPERADDLLMRSNRILHHLRTVGKPPSTVETAKETK